MGAYSYGFKVVSMYEMLTSEPPTSLTYSQPFKNKLMKSIYWLYYSSPFCNKRYIIKVAGSQNNELKVLE